MKAFIRENTKNVRTGDVKWWGKAGSVVFCIKKRLGHLKYRRGCIKYGRNANPNSVSMKDIELSLNIFIIKKIKRLACCCT